MRNLKKALALVLALMMALSLMVTASASTYADDSAIEQDEAVAVMSALGVFNGTDGGKFDPNGTLTRAQAAKIITYMLLGKEVADSLENTGSKFADCPDGRWYVGSVNYLTDLGIVAGRNETTYDPNGNVNGYEFAKMLLGALGYDSKTERFEGDSSWSVNIATTARRAGLNADLPVSAISSVALTREQAAKLAFNTLTATMVYYQGGFVMGDVTVNATRDNMANDPKSDYRGTTATVGADNYMQFCEQYFPGLKYNAAYATADDFGHTPAGCWMNGQTIAYTNLADADLTLTDAVNEAGLTKMLPKNPTSSSVTITTNGTSAEAASKTIAEIAALTGNGKKVEIYLNEKAITDVIVTSYTMETVTSITEKNDTTTYKFSNSGSKVNDEDNTNVIIAGEIAKGDLVTTVSASGKLYVYPTTKFTGSQTARKGETVTIGGAQYTIGSGVTNVDADAFTNSKDEGNYWVDMNGYLVNVAGIEAEVDINYALITGTVFGASTPSLDNPTTYTVNVRAVLDDGSVLDATLKLAIADKADGDIKAGDLVCGDIVVAEKDKITSDNVKKALEGKLFGYYIDDGKMVLEPVAEADTEMDGVCQQVLSAAYAGETSYTDEDSGVTVLFNSKTVFVIYSMSGSKVTAETHTGTTGLNIESTEVGVIVMSGKGDQGTAAVVFLETAPKAAAVDYVFIDVATGENVLNGDKDVYAYTGTAADGTTDTYYTSKKAELETSGLYVYDTDKVIGDALCLVDADPIANNAAPKAGEVVIVKGAQVNDELIKVGSAWVKMTDDTQVVLADGVEAVAGSNCIVVMKDAGEVAEIYAYETPAAED